MKFVLLIFGPRLNQSCQRFDAIRTLAISRNSEDGETAFLQLTGPLPQSGQQLKAAWTDSAKLHSLHKNYTCLNTWHIQQSQEKIQDGRDRLFMVSLLAKCKNICKMNHSWEKVDDITLQIWTYKPCNSDQIKLDEMTVYTFPQWLMLI